MLKSQIRLLAFAALAAALPLAAQNTFFLKDAPIAALDEGDWEILQQTIQDTLENQADDTEGTWENPTSGNSGKITPIRTFEEYGTTCRRVEFVVETKDEGTGVSRFNVCKAEDGTWKVAS